MKKPEVLPLFSTPVYRSSIDYELDIDLEKIDYERYNADNGWGSTNKEILLSRQFHSLKKKIEHHIHVYLFDVLRFSPIKIKHLRSWINLHNPGDYTPKHRHINSFLSGILYLKAPPNGGGINFVHPDCLPTFKTTTLVPNIEEFNIFNSSQWGYHDLVDNDIFLFPSHVDHFASKNEGEEDRYSVVFNYFLKGSFGDKETIEYLEV